MGCCQVLYIARHALSDPPAKSQCAVHTVLSSCDSFVIECVSSQFQTCNLV